MARPRAVRIVSWNVNGLRACVRKGFRAWLRGARADIVGLQEVRALPEELPHGLDAPRAWHAHFAAAERRGYSGVGPPTSRREAEPCGTTAAFPTSSTSIGRSSSASSGCAAEAIACS
jgi:exonuclease III